MDNVELLMSFGLTRQEARVYVLLLGEGALSGYEAAKRLGISRSNAYAALAGLVDKGGLYGRRAGSTVSCSFDKGVLLE